MEFVKKLTAQLEPYLPTGTAAPIAAWISASACEFTITRRRRSKFGDYRAPFNGRGHRIAVNGDLNPYAFLLTTIHEFAHLQTWTRFGAAVKPHGQEWKDSFRQLMLPFLQAGVFPDDIQLAIHRYLGNPAASSCADTRLFRALAQYDQQQPTNVTFLENLPKGSLFQTPDGRVFQKAEKVRIRFRCREVSSQRIYLFSPIAKVSPQ